MMNRNFKNVFAAAGLLVAVGLASSFSALTVPSEADGFVLLGHSLGLGQRDLRVNDGFTDSQANNNNSPHINFPGEVGAEMAIWKGAIEWSADLRAGNGSGDPVGGNLLGSGNANFDPQWQGTTGSLSNNANIVGVLSGTSGGTLAFMTGGGGGWNIRYYNGNGWDDGPSTISGFLFDIQAVMCHEYGHSLGLFHSGTGSATMAPSIGNGSESERSIHSDDIAGVQAIYGVESGTKPRITGLSGSTAPGQVLTITGNNFSSVNNQVWFTNASANGTTVKVTGLSGSGGVINVTVPATAADGDVMVQRNQSGNSSLSTAWPFDFDDGAPQPPTPTDITPNTGPNVGWTEVDIEGINFLGTTAVTFGGVNAQSFNVVNDALIEAVTPAGTNGATVDLVVTSPDGNGLFPSAYTYGFNPAVDIDTVLPNTGPVVGGTVVTITGPNVVPAFNIKFGGVAATNVQIVSMTELTCETPAGSPGAVVDVFIQGSGTDTIVGGFTYDGSPPGGNFVDIGPGLAGGLGTPLLSGTGDLTPLGAGATLSLTNAASSAPTVWFIGLTEAAVPLEGGILYPFPFLLLVVLVTDGSGELSIPVSVPVTAAGLDVIHQMYIEDVTGPSGYTASNGLRLEIP